MQRQDLALALKLVAPALHSRDFIPILTHVCFDGDSIFAFDDKTAVVVYEETGIRCAVRGRVLIDAVENSDDDLELDLQDHHLILSDGSSTLKLPSMGPESFLFSMPDTEACSVSISGDLEAISNLIDCLDIAAANSNEESLRPELVGVTLIAQDTLTLFSTDNISCTRVIVTDAEVAGEGVAILPKSSCQLLSKTFRDLKDNGLESCTFYLLEGSLLAIYEREEAPAVWVICKTISAEPADYDSILEKYLEESELGDVPEGFEKALSRASSMFKDDYSRVVSLSPLDGGFQMDCKGEYGELEAQIASEPIPEEPININPDLVRRMLSSCQALMFCSGALAMVSESDQREVTYLVAYKRA